jgi:uncharacterized membrane protein YkoI
MKGRAILLLLWLAAAGTEAATQAAGSAGPALSMDQAVRMVEQRYHARVVKAETAKDNGRTVYVLRLLSDSGRVWTVRVDASGGAVQ